MIELRPVDKGGVRDIVDTSSYIGGMVDMGSGHLHPLNLCLGEAEVAGKLGVRFYEYSPVVRASYACQLCVLRKELNQLLIPRTVL